MFQTRTWQGNYSKLYFNVIVVTRGSFWECQKDKPFAVRRAVRKPVFQVVVRYLFGLFIIHSCAASRHAPDVPTAGAVGVEVDPLAVRRVIGPIIVAGV